MSILDLGGTVVDWLQSFLFGTTQQVLYDDVMFGVPQESVIGPVVFILYRVGC